MKTTLQKFLFKVQILRGIVKKNHNKFVYVFNLLSFMRTRTTEELSMFGVDIE